MHDPDGSELSLDVFDRAVVLNRESRAMEMLDGLGVCTPNTTTEAVPVAAEKDCSGG